MTQEPVHVLSLGAGVQSSTVALMASAGEIQPKLVEGIFADTKAEPKSVMDWLEWLEKQLSFPVVRVSRGNLEEDALRVRLRKDGMGSWVPSGVPHYSVNQDGSEGHGPRQCTGDFKLDPILKEQNRLVKDRIRPWRKLHKPALKALSLWREDMAEQKRRKKQGLSVEFPIRPEWAWMECQADPLLISWIGISMDEASRVKDSLKDWAVNRYPLIEMGMTRNHCLKWMKDRGYPTPPRSACVFCPYHSNAEWRRLKLEEPAEFERAVQFEKKYQAAKAQTVSIKHFKPFLHNSRVNLDQVDFSTEEDRGQMNMFTNECLGMCGV